MRVGQGSRDIGMGNHRSVLSGGMTRSDMYWESMPVARRTGRGKQVNKSGHRKIDQNPSSNPGEKHKGLNVSSSGGDGSKDRNSHSSS